MRYAGVSDSRGENNAERGNEDEAGDESQNPRCGTDFISGVSSCARLFSVFAEEYGRRNFLNWITVTIWCRFRKSDGSGFTAKGGIPCRIFKSGGQCDRFSAVRLYRSGDAQKMESFWKVSLLGFMFSLCVETIQLITKVGCFDVDDLMLNTLGAMIGCGAFLICNKFRRWKYGEEEV